MPPAQSISPDSAGAPSPDAHARWFNDEVHSHDSSLRKYLRGAFPAVRDVDDVVQESYLRIWKAKAQQPIVSAKAFLFRVARNVVLDGLRRSYISPIAPVGDLAALAVIDENNAPSAALDVSAKAGLLSDALSKLSPRSREVIILCKLNGLTHQAAAIQLGIAEKTVDEHMLRGLKRLSDILRRRGHDDIFGA